MIKGATQGRCFLPKQIRTYLNGKKDTVLFEALIKRVCHQLEQKCRDVDLW